MVMAVFNQSQGDRIDIQLRPAQETDVPRLIEIARRAWLSAFAQNAPFEAAQGRGIGFRLLSEAERQIGATGFDRAWLTCSAYNSRAQRFYERSGYRVVERFVERFGEVDEPVLRMEKALAIRS
jgi:Acetyltransferase (GNAT) family